MTTGRINQNSLTVGSSELLPSTEDVIIMQ